MEEVGRTAMQMVRYNPSQETGDMLSAKPMAMVAVLALAGVAVGQQSFEGWPTNLPQLAELLEELPEPGLGLQEQTYKARVLLRLTDTNLAKHAFSEGYRRELEFACGYFLRWLAQDYSRFRSEGRVPSVPMMQLLLLCRVSCSKPEIDFLRWPEEMIEDKGVMLRDVANDLLQAAEAEEDRLLGHLYLLHEGDVETRIQTALTLAQVKSLAADVVPHLIEELDGENSRVIQETITALGMIGPSAKDAIPALEALAEHDDPQIAERAKSALKQIKGDGRP